MTVSELIEKLKVLDPKHDVLCCCEDEKDVSVGDFRLFDIVDINVIEVEKTRVDESKPYLKLGNSPLSKPHVIIELNSEF